MRIPFLSRATTCGALLVLGLCTQTANAEYLLSAPPRESTQVGERVYGPLAEYLTQTLGEQVVYQHPGDWGTYARKIKKGEYDFIFDGPHFAAWRIQNGQALPLVKLPGILEFLLVSLSSNAQVTKTNDLLGRKICTLPSPNLGALSLYAMYPNPAQQPDFINVQGGFEKIVDELMAGKCLGAIVRKDTYLNSLSNEARARLRVLAESRGMTNQGITVNPRIGTEDRAKLAAALTSPAGLQAAQALLQRFSKKSPNFLLATTADYDGQNLLSDNMIFGW